MDTPFEVLLGERRLPDANRATLARASCREAVSAFRPSLRIPQTALPAGGYAQGRQSEESFRN